MTPTSPHPRGSRDSALVGPWYAVLAINAPARGSSAEWDFVTVLPAALSLAELGKPFVVGWLSRGGGAPLELLTNAGPLTDDAPRDLMFPSGARGVPVGDDRLADLDRMVWTPCLGRQAPPLDATHGDRENQDGRQPTLFESTLVTLMGRPFAWLVVAERTDQLDAEVAELRTSLNVLRRCGDTSERSRFDAERAERRMAELDAFREAGLWNVRVLAGAATPEDLRQVAPVLVGSVEMRHHPYRLRSGDGALPLTDALVAAAADPVDGAAYPFAATAGTLAALAGLPRREVPGLRVLDTGYFDVTSEAGARDAADGQPAVELGSILDAQDRPVGAFAVPLPTLNRHVFVCGATGAGKSQTVRHLLEQLSRAGLPWLAIEPAKSEYAAMAGRLADLGAAVTVVNPSDPGAVPLSVNPLEPEPGYPVQAHIDMVRALFQAAFDAEKPFPQIMSQTLQRVYEENGWDVVTGGGIPGAAAAPTVPTLDQLQQTALQVISDVGYGRELMSDVRGFVDVRLRSLRVGSAGRFFEGGHPVDIAGLLRRNVVLAIEDVANDEDKAFLMGTLIIRVVEHLRLRARRERATGLRHVIVIEEAHRLLRDRGARRSSAHAVELFAGMLAEIRAYGEGIVVTEQIPTKLVPDVVKNTALKIVHRLPAADDRALVGAAINLADEHSSQVMSLPPGVAAVFADGMDRPLRIRVPLGEGRERVAAGPAPPIQGRRSAACGERCREAGACTLLQLREADLLARSTGWAWLRIWADVLVLAHLANRPLPWAPREATMPYATLDRRTGECLLATVVESCVQRRAWALRTAFDPADVTEVAAAVGRRLLDGHAGVAGRSPGRDWVIPQLQWLHEVERLFPYGRNAPSKYDEAPPLDYPIVAERGEKLLGHRVRALRRHRLSMELDRNRAIGQKAVLGDDDHAEFVRDLAIVAIAVDPDDQVRHVAAKMRVESWLESVLAWPNRFVRSFGAGTGPLPFFES